MSTPAPTTNVSAPIRIEPARSNLTDQQPPPQLFDPMMLSDDFYDSLFNDLKNGKLVDSITIGSFRFTSLSVDKYNNIDVCMGRCESQGEVKMFMKPANTHVLIFKTFHRFLKFFAKHSDVSVKLDANGEIEAEKLQGEEYMFRLFCEFFKEHFHLRSCKPLNDLWAEIMIRNETKIEVAYDKRQGRRATAERYAIHKKVNEAADGTKEIQKLLKENRIADEKRHATMSTAVQGTQEAVAAGFEGVQEAVEAGFEGVKSDANARHATTSTAVQGIQEAVAAGFDGVESDANARHATMSTAVQDIQVELKKPTDSVCPKEGDDIKEMLHKKYYNMKTLKPILLLLTPHASVSKMTWTTLVAYVCEGLLGIGITAVDLKTIKPVQIANKPAGFYDKEAYSASVIELIKSKKAT
ncbi:hypothetical protein MPSEU_000424700 [Mayamaea pseudoterrestris]|nr:hypothetical protein MPSEU_000424700 [Mayamaea pseudoterrestris]